MNIDKEKLKYHNIKEFMILKDFSLIKDNAIILKFKHNDKTFYYSADIIRQLNEMFNIDYCDIVISYNSIHIIKDNNKLNKFLEK